MKKIILQPVDSSNTFTIRSGDNKILFEANADRFDKIVEWLFENTTHRFVFLGTNIIYFENDNDAVHFMMVWG
jgi:hypothetical protein